MGHRKYTLQEDAVIRKYAGIKSAEEIGMMIGRPKNGVHHRIKRLGLTGHLHGDHHWNAKVDSLKISMIHTLLDSGFKTSEIYRMFNEPLNLSKNYISQIACARYRRSG